MQCLKLDGTKDDARRLARTLIGSLCDDGLKLEAVSELKTFIISINWALTHYDSIILPVETLKFCPFVAMRESVECEGFAPTIAGGDRVHGFIESFEENMWGVTHCKGSTQMRMVNENITLDIAAALLMDGVTEVTI